MTKSQLLNERSDDREGIQRRCQFCQYVQWLQFHLVSRFCDGYSFSIIITQRNEPADIRVTPADPNVTRSMPDEHLVHKINTINTT